MYYSIVIGVLFICCGAYGLFSTYRLLRHNELFWAYPNLRYRKEKGYSKKICKAVAMLSLPFAIFSLYLGVSIIVNT